MQLKRTGAKLHARGTSYLVAERKHTTPKKTKYFLLQKEPKERYISSLYGEYPSYQFEYRGKRYQLTLTDTSATIREVEEVSNV